MKYFAALCLACSAGVLYAAETSVTNGELTVTWNSDTKTVSLGDFAQCVIADGTDTTVVKHPLPGRGGKTVNASTLMITSGNETSSLMNFTVASENPFVLITRPLLGGLFKDGELKNVELPKIEIIGHCNKSLGTGGLKDIGKDTGSYMFLAVADGETNNGIVSGFTTSRNGCGIVHFTGGKFVQPVVEYGKLLLPQSDDPRDSLSEVFVIGKFDDCRNGLEQYAEQIAAANNVKIKPPVAGYCTWYAEKHGGASDEKAILELTNAAAEKLASFGFNFIQIDDKWQDGKSNNGPLKNFMRARPDGPYPGGMKPVADYILSKGMKAGLWLIPFAGSDEDPHWNKDMFLISSITDETDEKGKPKLPNKRIANKKGMPFKTQWSGTCLDLTDPAVQEYLRKEFEQMARDWHYNYFKLDGSNAGLGVENVYVNNEYKKDYFGESISKNPEITPVAACRLGYDIIRKAVGEETFLLGCNMSQNMRVMGSSFGKVDAMRIGPDNGPGWGALKQGPWHGTNRYFLNGRVWWNDPDPVYVRKSVPLNKAQLIASWVSVSGQLFAFSDWLLDLPEERLEILRRTMRPHGLPTARPVDLFSSDLPRIWVLTKEQNAETSRQSIVAFYNWDDKKEADIGASFEQLELDNDEQYVAFDFWGNKTADTGAKEIRTLVPPASCVVLSVRRVEEHPFVLSTSQHVTQGMIDIVSEKWDAAAKTLSGVSKVIACDPYELRIYNPATKELIRKEFKPEKTQDDFQWDVKF